MPHKSKLRRLIAILEGRLDVEFLNFSVDYIGNGELCVALETLCDYLCEDDVVLSEAEYKDIIELGKVLGADLNSGRFVYIKSLVK